MPRSKRAKVVSLSKTQKVGASKEFRKAKVNLVRDAVDEYKNIFIFSFANLRESKMKEVRMEWKESRIYMGKNRVAQVALGKTPEDEVRDNLHLLSQVRKTAHGRWRGRRPTTTTIRPHVTNFPSIPLPPFFFLATRSGWWVTWASYSPTASDRRWRITLAASGSQSSPRQALSRTRMSF